MANHLKFGTMENSGVGENLMLPSLDSLASVFTMCRNDENEGYVVLLDVSKAAVVQRMLKWSGLKPVSFICTYCVSFESGHQRRRLIFYREYVGVTSACLSYF